MFVLSTFFLNASWGLLCHPPGEQHLDLFPHQSSSPVTGSYSMGMSTVLAKIKTLDNLHVFPWMARFKQRVFPTAKKNMS